MTRMSKTIVVTAARVARMLELQRDEAALLEERLADLRQSISKLETIQQQRGWATP